MTGTIFDIQRFSVHDGPGIRTTVFMKGCSLRCQWCHNPEGLSPYPQLQYTKQECIHCGRCSTPPAPSDAEHCPTGALKICGSKWEEEPLLDLLLQDQCFYDEDGGVTFSGGECLLQADFISNMLKRLKKLGINTAIDTAGYVPWKNFQKTLEDCDLYLYDIKIRNPQLHTKYTGADNTLILNNLRSLCTLGKRIWIRIPIIPDINDTMEEMMAIHEFIRPFDSIEKITLMPYHTLGKSKYETLGIPCLYHTQKTVSSETIHQFAEIFGEKATQ